MKSIIVYLLAVFQVLLFVHYALVTDEIRIVVLLLEVGIRGLIFYLVALFFLKRSAKLLRNKKKSAYLVRLLAEDVPIIHFTKIKNRSCFLFPLERT